MGPFRVRLGQGGRITLPAALRRALGLAPGDPVTLIPGAGGVRLMAGGPGFGSPWPVSGPPSLVQSASRPNRLGQVERVFKRMVDLRSLILRPPGTQAQVMSVVVEPYLSNGFLDPAQLSRLLGPFAVSRPVEVIVADPGVSVRCETRWWRFPDDSRLFAVTRPSRYPLVVETDRDGLGSSGMVDHPRALRAALRSDRPELVEGYVRCHGALPRLDQGLLLLALESPSSAVRLAAIASLSTSASPPGDENGGVGWSGSLQGDRHPEPDRGSVAGAAPADIPAGADRTVYAPRETPAPEAR